MNQKICHHAVSFMLPTATLDRLDDLCKLHKLGEADIISKALLAFDERPVSVDVLNEHHSNMQKTAPVNAPSPFFKSIFGLE